MITVYGAPPTRALRVIWILEEMGLDHRVEPMKPFDRDTAPERLAASPVGLLPALEDGPVRMSESVAIIEYLAARYGPTSLAPGAAEPEYPTYLQFLHFGEASLAAPLNLAVAARFFAPETEKANWGSELAVRLAVKRCGVLAGRLEQTPFLAGERFTAADISCAYALNLLNALGRMERVEATVVAWWERLKTRPAYLAAERHHAPLM